MDPLSEFRNEEIPSKDLPRAEKVTYNSLHINKPKADIAVSMIFMSILFIGLAVLWYFKSDQPLLCIVASVANILLTVFIVFYCKKSYNYTGYAVREKDFLFKEGIWWQSISIVPYSRVQHCEIDQGPIDRMFGLCSLQLFSAGGSSSDIEVDGLTQEQATAIKQYIMSKVTSVNEQE
jgi:hypothetical protein